MNPWIESSASVARTVLRGHSPGLPWVAASAVDSRIGFASALPEFLGLAAPEQEDSAVIALTFEEDVTRGELRTGAPVYLECELTGTFVGGTLAATGSVGGYSVDVAATLSGATLSGTVTLTNGAHEEVRSFAAARGAGPVTIASGHWVDATNGDDGNDGASQAQALATIGALPALAEGDTVYLARGSRWREQLDARSGVGPITVAAYGIGPRPILDAADPTDAADWSLLGGYTNVYTASVTLDATSPASNSALVLLDGGRMLSLVDTLAECEANAGTCVEVTAQASPATVRIHPFDSLAPSDGQVEVSTRESGLDVVGSSTVRGVMTRAGWGNHGGLNVPYESDDDSATVDDCVSVWGAKHNALVNSGAITRSVTFGSHPGSESSSAWVIYRNNIATHTGPTPTMTDCAAIVWSYQAVSINGNNITALYEHDSQDPVNFWPRIDLDRCGAKNVGKWEGTNLFCVDSMVEGQLTGAGAFTCKQSGEVTRCRVYCASTSNSTARGMHTVAGSIAVTDCIFDLNNPSGGPIYCDEGSLTVTGCVMRCQNTGKRAIYTDASNTPAIPVFRENVILANCNGVSVHNSATGSDLQDSDYNVMRGTAGWKESQAATNRSFATYIGDQATLDQNSYTTAPTYETGTDATTGRPLFLETAASELSRGFGAGPSPSRPGGAGWATLPTYEAWTAFLAVLEA